MALILTRFVHRDCSLSNVAGCTAVEGVDFGVEKWHFQITSNVVDTITAATKAHVVNIHKAKDVTVRLLAAFFIWEGGGNSSNLLVMDSDRARRQIQLAIDRSCDDRLHVEFLAKFSTSTDSSAVGKKCIAGSSQRGGQANGWT